MGVLPGNSETWVGEEILEWMGECKINVTPVCVNNPVTFAFCCGTSFAWTRLLESPAWAPIQYKVVVLPV